VTETGSLFIVETCIRCTKTTDPRYPGASSCLRRERFAFDKAGLSCKNAGFVDAREFSQLLLLPLVELAAGRVGVGRVGVCSGRMKSAS
jgi:hypothetical protein